MPILTSDNLIMGPHYLISMMSVFTYPKISNIEIIPSGEFFTVLIGDCVPSCLNLIYD